MVDGGSRTILFVLDGILLDGGSERYYGYAKFSPTLGDINGTKELQLNTDDTCPISMVRIYDRALSTSEAIGDYNYHKNQLLIFQD